METCWKKKKKVIKKETLVNMKMGIYSTKVIIDFLNNL